MRRVSGLAAAGALLLAGCSSDPAAPEAEHGDAPQATAPPEALATPSTVPSRMDAATLLGPEGDLELLANKVEGDLSRLTSLHLVDVREGERATFVIDEERCSGEVRESGVTYAFVTTTDGQMYLGHPTEEDQWYDGAADGLTSPCPHGPGSVVSAALGSMWGFVSPERLGPEVWNGERLIHFRRQSGQGRVDSWIQADADGVTTRLFRVVMRANGARRTLLLSQHDAAPPVAPVPPEDQVFHPGQA